MQLEREFRGRVGVRFTVRCPETPADAQALIEFIDSVQHAREAIVGVGLWGCERPASLWQSSFDICCGPGGLLGVNVHAGEHSLQCCADDGREIDKGAHRCVVYSEWSTRSGIKMASSLTPIVLFATVEVKLCQAKYNGPQNIKDALGLAGIRRIGHGIEAIKSRPLMQELANADVCLEICPVSNRLLGYVPRLDQHPLPQLLAHGVTCCIAADDPSCLGKHVNPSPIPCCFDHSE